MNDLISRQDAINAVEESRRLNHHQDGKEACAHEYEHRHFLKILMELPPAEPERKRGKWIPKRDCRYHCSLCDGIAPKGYRWDYCPNCGADMRTEVQDG